MCDSLCHFLLSVIFLMTLSCGFLPSSIMVFLLLPMSGFKEVSVHKVAEVHEWGPEGTLRLRVTPGMLHPVEDQVVNDTASECSGTRCWMRQASRRLGNLPLSRHYKRVSQRQEPQPCTSHLWQPCPRRSAGVQERSGGAVSVQDDQLLPPQSNAHCVY